MGDKLHGLKKGQTGIHVGGEAGYGQDSKEVRKPSTKKHGASKSDDCDNASRRGNGGYANGENGHQSTIEWEQKWDNGVQPHPVSVEVDNPYQVLKAETEV